MKVKNKKRLATVCGMLFCLLLGYVFRGFFPAAGRLMENSALFSAAMMMPEGGAELARELYFSGGKAVTLQVVPPMSREENPTAPPPDNHDDAPKPEETAAPAPVIPEANRMPIQAEKIGHAGQNYENIWLQNRTKHHTVDIKKELSLPLDFKIEKNGKPQVLIVHTHTTEGFEMYDRGHYDKTASSRTTEEAKNITRVGAAITASLKTKGIEAIHDTTIHDYPSYNGAYDRSRVTIQSLLKKHPTIRVVIDVHRDAITRDNGVKVKPVATVNGRQAAQIMIVTGCDDDGTLKFPDWERNLRFAVRLQQHAETLYPGLARPVSFAVKRYNMDLNHGSLLVEFGSEANTLAEAVYSGELFADCLSKMTE